MKRRLFDRQLKIEAARFACSRAMTILQTAQAR